MQVVYSRYAHFTGFYTAPSFFQGSTVLILLDDFKGKESLGSSRSRLQVLLSDLTMSSK